PPPRSPPFLPEGAGCCNRNPPSAGVRSEKTPLRPSPGQILPPAPSPRQGSSDLKSPLFRPGRNSTPPSVRTKAPAPARESVCLGRPPSPLYFFQCAGGCGPLFSVRKACPFSSLSPNHQ